MSHFVHRSVESGTGNWEPVTNLTTVFYGHTEKRLMLQLGFLRMNYNLVVAHLLFCHSFMISGRTLIQIHIVKM